MNQQSNTTTNLSNDVFLKLANANLAFFTNMRKAKNQYLSDQLSHNISIAKNLINASEPLSLTLLQQDSLKNQQTILTEYAQAANQHIRTAIDAMQHGVAPTPQQSTPSEQQAAKPKVLEAKVKTTPVKKTAKASPATATKRVKAKTVGPNAAPTKNPVKPKQKPEKGASTKSKPRVTKGSQKQVPVATTPLPSKVIKKQATMIDKKTISKTSLPKVGADVTEPNSPKKT